ncbi:galactose oxidase-like domain-containing protein [Mycolicibacterium moriokaense]|uniref:Concanavalin A-like lectin/glucanase superfamily protein n=1 Tax=Mycolicibacterium moriokaense TaxID=39691 RepID=A0A318H5A5_9MYCO|nr:galactose oxidase-like domain-containing protein [Mycolicibacterium moriokaense]PXW99147.1 concanavalin A-like lectin/glucanase superfamily protein [Mycolicibacterium moriokaense]
MANPVAAPAPAADVAAVDPATQGSWQVLPFNSEVLAVHAVLLHTGKVLFAAGSGNSTVRFADQNFGNTAMRFWTSAVWDPTVSAPPGGQDTNFFHPDTKRDAQGKVLDFFCGGETPLEDGLVLTTGGTAKYPGGGTTFQGRADTLVFDPATEQWAVTRSMAHGRWYPSVISLGDGRVLAAGGFDEGGAGTRNPSLETFFHHSDYWQQVAMPGGFGGLPLYAHLYLLADGSVCYAGGHQDDNPAAPLRLDLTRSPATIIPVPGLSRIDARDAGASVVLPPAQDQRVMLIGGASQGGDAIADVDVVDFTQPSPAYQSVAAMHVPRKHVNATLLPDRTVLVTGGSEHSEQAAVATNHAEIFDPAHPERGWTQLAAASVVRMYHSVALLLPDGRVVTASGNPAQGNHVDWRPNDPNEELRLEVFSPPYLARGPRPSIGAVPTEWRYGQTVTIATPDAATLRDVSLIRPGATTHSFNTSQRLVDLPITSRDGAGVQVQVTSEPNLAPPSWYMLFLTNTDGVPSVASWVHLAGAPATATPAGSYAQTVLGTPGLVAYWPLAETGGTVAYDIAGAHHGSYLNHPHLGASGPGPATAVTFNGTDQYALVPRDVRNDFSLEVWFSSHGGGVGTGNTQWWQGAGLLDGETPGVVDDFGTSLDATGQVWAGTGNPDTSIHSAPGFNDGAWHHVVFTRSQATGALTLYVDGVSVASGQGGTQPLFSPPGLRLGALQSGAAFYAGSLVDAAVYDTALPGSTVAAHFSSQQPTQVM